VSVIDTRGRIVATTGPYRYMEVHPQLVNDLEPGLRGHDGLIIAVADASGVATLDGLKLRAVIEEHVATDDQIASALNNADV
jgi:hypothetical protein